MKIRHFFWEQIPSPAIKGMALVVIHKHHGPFLQPRLTWPRAATWLKPDQWDSTLQEIVLGWPKSSGFSIMNFLAKPIFGTEPLGRLPGLLFKLEGHLPMYTKKEKLICKWKVMRQTWRRNTNDSEHLVCVRSSGSQWRTGKPGALQPRGPRRVGHGLGTEQKQQGTILSNSHRTEWNSSVYSQGNWGKERW